jgi:hypothetical protein
MTNLMITNPFGSTTSQKFQAKVGWSEAFSNNVDILGQFLSVSSKSGSGQGTCVDPIAAQNSGVIYWEVTWTGLLDTALQGGIGLISLDALVAVNTAGEAFNALAADGTGGLVVRPDGTVYETVPNGNGVGPNNPPWPLSFVAFQEGDTLGIKVDFDSFKDAGFIAVQIVGVGGSIKGVTSGTFFPPWAAYIPAAVFDATPSTSLYFQTANFGATPLLGPTAVPDFGWDGITLGWPSPI